MFPESTLTASEEVLQMTLTVNVGQINHAHEKFVAAQNQLQTFTIVMVACSKILEQRWMKTVMVEMAMMLKRLMTMVLQANNKVYFHCVILQDSLIL